MTVFCAILDVNSSICKLWDIYWDILTKKMPFIFNKQFYNAVNAYDSCVIFAQTT